MWCGRKVTLAMLLAARNKVADPAVAGPPTQENKTMPYAKTTFNLGDKEVGTPRNIKSKIKGLHPP